MTKTADTAEPRRRAPSRRSLETRARILNAAEAVFARQGFDGATMRDIADKAGEAVSLVHHHGGGKEALFRQVVARRADELSAARVSALAAARAAAPEPSVEDVLAAFIAPLLDRAAKDDGWCAYARLIAHVSADERWRDLAAERFDPTARRFIDAVCAAAPGCDRRAAAAGFVYAISATLAHVTAGWRIGALGGDAGVSSDLIVFCAGGLRRL